MVRPLCFIRTNELVEITLRTIDGRALLRPSAEINACIQSALARALELHEIDLHAFIFLSNHAHLLARVADARHLAGFTRDLKRETARGIQRITGYSGRVWVEGGRAIPVLDDNAGVGRMRYIASNGVKEGLVDRPQDWPGVSSVDALLGDMRMEAPPFKSRPRNRHPGTLERWRAEPGVPQVIRLAPLPAWRGTSDRQRQRHVQAMIDSIILEGIEIRRGAPSLGVAGVLSMDPMRTFDLDETPPPLAHFTDPVRFEEFLAQRSHYDAGYRLASRRLREAPRVRFPSGAFLPSPGFEEV